MFNWPNHGVHRLDECLPLAVSDVENKTVEQSSTEPKHGETRPGSGHGMGVLNISSSWMRAIQMFASGEYKCW